MEIIDKPLSRSSDIVHCKSFFIIFIFENDRSAVATVIGNVKYKIKAGHTSGYVVVRGECSMNNISAISFIVFNFMDIIFLKHDRKDNI